MAILNILHFPDPQLRKKATPIKTVDEDIQNLAKNMLETMYANHGIGLAATQVNIQQRLVVIDLSENKDQPIYLVNPEILQLEGNIPSQEGCLSIPEYYDTVNRAEKISYCYQDLRGKQIELTASGLLSVCIQHEIDHLDGKLFVDYLSPMKRRILSKKIEKKKKLHATPL